MARNCSHDRRLIVHNCSCFSPSFLPYFVNRIFFGKPYSSVTVPFRSAFISFGLGLRLEIVVVSITVSRHFMPISCERKANSYNDSLSDHYRYRVNGFINKVIRCGVLRELFFVHFYFYCT